MKLFILMLIVTTAEVVLITKVGSAIGFFPTFLIIIATAMIGSWQLKKQGMTVIKKLQAMQDDSSTSLIEGIILFACGILLITPGFITDIVGFLCLIPSLRVRLAKKLKSMGKGSVSGSSFIFTSSSFTRSSNQKSNSRQIDNNENIIEAEFYEETKD